MTDEREPVRERIAELKRSYDAVAEDYAREFLDELDGKPFDRELLCRFSKRVPPPGRIADIGCGPGHVGAHLGALGHDVLGVDLSPRMVDVARRLHPSLEFRVGDMRDLDLPDGSLEGIVAFYSVIHVARNHVDDVLAGMFRVLSPAGRLLVAFHRGEGELTVDEWFDKPVRYFATLFEPREVADSMERCGFTVDGVDVREPYGFEHPTVRVYVSASKPR